MSRYAQQQQPPPPPPPPQPQPRRQVTTNGFGEEIDEAGGIGDELDSVSMRDIASVRYIRHHEWMELVLGSAVPTSKILPPKVIPESQKDNTNGIWQFDDAESVQKLVDDLQKENDELEKNRVKESNNDRQEFFKQGILKLRNEFGKADTAADEELIKEIESKFPGTSVVDKKRVRRVNGELGLPEPQKKDPNFDAMRLQHQQQKEEEQRQKDEEETARKAEEQAQEQKNQHENGNGKENENDGDVTMGGMDDNNSNTNNNNNTESQQPSQTEGQDSNNQQQPQPAEPPQDNTQSQPEAQPSQEPATNQQSQDGNQSQPPQEQPQPQPQSHDQLPNLEDEDVTMENVEPNTAGEMLNDDLSDVLNM